MTKREAIRRLLAAMDRTGTPVVLASTTGAPAVEAVNFACPSDVLRALVAHDARDHRARQIRKERAQARARRGPVGPLRCAALAVDHPSGRTVHVLFRNPDGTTIGYYMAPATYHALTLLKPATPDDFRKRGALTPAPSEFQYQEAPHA